jgi:signal-transduction protein with cAMP-binding, CBS, and nucleotidyltransferase domain
VRSDRLSSLERDLLRDALAVVKRFKAIVRNRSTWMRRDAA